MNKLLIVLLGGLAFASVHAQQLTPQQERMKTCNASASERELKGDERQSFMSRCLKGESTLTSQQERMRMCNVQASERQLKGDARQEFMSDCLKNSEALSAQMEKKRADAANRSAATGR